MKILVTGGAGFLGANLCANLLEEGHEIFSLDNFHSGREENYAPLTRSSRFHSIIHDIRSPLTISHKIDQIYHLACPASPKFYQSDPIYTTETCVLGSLNVLNLAVEKKAKILFTSTSEVYGDPEVHPQPESYRGSVNPIGIRACYDEGKRCAESLFYDFQRTHHLDVRVARLFNTYGPLMRPDDGRVVSNFICQSILKSPITIYGDGMQTRSFCHSKDLIRGLKMLMDSDTKISHPINLGNPGEFTLLELVNQIELLIDRKLELKFFPLPLDDPKKRKPDITIAKKILDWEPKILLEDGLKDTYNYFKSELQS
ncbi:SDR family oxidoreductase [Gammaproteobacteria bacterium]|nr:SDR family oxidoreductase [Gammaproteobacteria bacterium]